MRYEELQENGEREMDDLLAGNGSQTVNINGREVYKRKASVIKQHKNEKAVQENPISQLGYGIVAYLDILYSMVWAFIVFSLMLIPTM